MKKQRLGLPRGDVEVRHAETLRLSAPGTEQWQHEATMLLGLLFPQHL